MALFLLHCLRLWVPEGMNSEEKKAGWMLYIFLKVKATGLKPAFTSICEIPFLKIAKLKS